MNILQKVQLPCFDGLGVTVFKGIFLRDDYLINESAIKAFVDHTAYTGSCIYFICWIILEICRRELKTGKGKGGRGVKDNTRVPI